MILNLLENLHKKNIEYVSWKNNHEIDLVLKGESDLDLFVPLNYKRDFESILEENNWIKVINPVAYYPFINHYYKIDGSATCYHIHVYFKIITGESWLKEYDLPVEDYLIKNRILHNENSIYKLTKEAQASLFFLRHFLKGASFFSRVLYRKELSSYQEEWDYCFDGYNPGHLDLLKNSPEYFKHSGLLGNKISLPKMSAARNVRKELQRYLRIEPYKLPFLRGFSFLRRFLNKLFFKKAKVFEKKGPVIAFSGGDGAGKSTMIDEVSSAFRNFMSVKMVFPGKPQSSWLEKSRLKLKGKTENYSATKSSQNNSYLKILKSIFLALLRLWETKKAEYYSNKGYLVIADRWPTIQTGIMDGPKLLKNPEDSILKKILTSVEHNIYNRIPYSDFCFYLDIPIDVAVERNRNRNKEGKETDQEIIERHQENSCIRPKSKEFIKFDNDGDLLHKKEELLDLIQNRIVSFQENDK